MIDLLAGIISRVASLRDAQPSSGFLKRTPASSKGQYGLRHQSYS